MAACFERYGVGMSGLWTSRGASALSRLLVLQTSPLTGCVAFAKVGGVKIVHAADLHLDSPMRGLERYEGAPVEAMREATRRALENLVELCQLEEASLLLLAGDLFDGDWKDYSTGLFFAARMSELRQAGVKVVMIRGNHDAQSQVKKHLSLPHNVTELATRKPQTVRFDELDVAVHGQGFAKRAVTEDLAASYPDPLPGMLNIGLLHTCLTGREGHEPYAPTHLETLVGKGYDYWALGHVHEREVLSEKPWVVFPGNLQGRHARETGAKGATLITVSDGSIAKVEHRPVDAARWHRAVIDVTDASSGYDVVDAVRESLEEAWAAAGGRTLAVRVELVGRSEAHAVLQDDREQWVSAIRASAIDVGEVWVEKVKIDTAPSFDLAELAQRDDAIGQVVRSLQALAGDDDALARLAQDKDLKAMEQKLPKELRLRDPDGGLRLDAGLMREAVADAEQLLLARLLAHKERA